MKNTVSESQALERIRAALQEIEGLAGVDRRGMAISNLAREADGFVQTLLSQASRGIHRNPPLVIFGNPPLHVGRRVHSAGAGRIDILGEMSHDVHELRYTHLDDGKSYKHVFESGDVGMYAVTTGNGRRLDILLTGGSGQPLWKDFD